MASLYDALLRHQTFLEGLKVNQNDILEKDVIYIFSEFVKEIKELDIDTLDQLSKAKVSSILSSFKALITRVYSKYSIDFIDFLEKFARIEVSIHSILMKSTDTAIDKFVPMKTFGRAFIDSVWAKIKASDVPANGLNALAFIKNFGMELYVAISKAFKMSVVNAQRPRELLEAILGFEGKKGIRKGGLLKRYVNYASSLVETAIQHVSSQVQSAVHAVFSDEYVWISVIDNVTTEVCTSRDQNVYTYGGGPLPPAHPRCRSKTIPRPSVPKGAKRYSEWFTEQPDDVQQAMQEGLEGMSLPDYQKSLSRMQE